MAEDSEILGYLPGTPGRYIRKRSPDGGEEGAAAVLQHNTQAQGNDHLAPPAEGSE